MDVTVQRKQGCHECQMILQQTDDTMICIIILSYIILDIFFQIISRFFLTGSGMRSYCVNIEISVAKLQPMGRKS